MITDLGIRAREDDFDHDLTRTRLGNRRVDYLDLGPLVNLSHLPSESSCHVPDQYTHNSFFHGGLVQSPDLARDV